MRSSRFTESNIKDAVLDRLAVNQFTVAEDTLEQRPDVFRQAHHPPLIERYNRLDGTACTRLRATPRRCLFFLCHRVYT